MNSTSRMAVCALVIALVLETGFAAQGRVAPRRILIVADDLSLQFCYTPRVRDLMRHALQTLKRDGDLVGMTSTGRSGLTVPLSRDWTEPYSAVSRITGEALSSRSVAGAQPTSEIESSLRLRAATSSAIVAKALRPIPASGSGPLIVLFFTDGYPASVADPAELIQEALRVNATIYAIDPRGFEEVGPECIPEREAYIAATQGSLQTLASQTGGSVISTVGEFDALLSRVAQDR